MAEYTITNEPDTIPFETRGDTIGRIIRNAKNLLMTRMGDVPYDSLKGFDTRLFDLPMSDFLTELPAEIDRLMLWEWRVKVVSADAELKKDAQGLYRGVLITVVIDVQIDE